MSQIFGRTGRDSLRLNMGQIPNIFHRTVWIGNYPPNYRGEQNNKALPNLFGFVGGIYESSFPCGICDEGDIPQCESCEEGGYNCEECDGEGYCQECEGEEFQECEDCRGEGEQICDKCEGDWKQVSCEECEDGWKKCSECKGEPVIECDECEGAGIIEKETCSNCDGEGTTECEECAPHEGYIDCDSCEEGYIDCDECEEGYTDCQECDNGVVDCRYCDDGSCEYCDLGWIECGDCGGDWEGGECYGCGGLGVYISQAAAKNRGTHYVKPIASKRKQRIIKFNKLKKTLGDVHSQEVFGEFNSVVFYPAHLINSRWATLNFGNLKTVTYIIYPAIVGNDDNTEYDATIVPLSKSKNSAQISRTIELRENRVWELTDLAVHQRRLDFSVMANRYKPYPQYEAAIVVTDIPISEKIPFLNYITSPFIKSDKDKT